MRSSASILLMLIWILGEFLPISSGIILQLDHRPQEHSLRNRQSAEANSLLGGITTNGAFYAQISLGSPPQTFYVQVDTGSSDFLVYGSECASTGCTNGDVHRFQISGSTTAHVVSCSNQAYSCAKCSSFNGIPNSCQFQDAYGGGGLATSTMVTDIFKLGQFPALNVSLGYIQTLSGSFESPPASGIWGLAYSSLGHGKTIMDLMVAELGIIDIFSICLQNGNPLMSIGVDYASNAAFQWVDVVTPSYYTVNMLDFKVNGLSLGLPSSTYTDPFCVLDSGTTLLMLPQNAFNSFYSSLKAMCAHVTLSGLCDVSDSAEDIFHGRCFLLSASQISNYPRLQISIEGIGDLNLEPQSYISTTGGFSCSGIVSGGVGSPTILGDIFMQNFHIVFDRSSNRIGFGELSTCPDAGLIPQSKATEPVKRDLQGNLKLRF